MKILLLEDDIALNRAIKKVTELDGNITMSYEDGQDVFDNLDDIYDLYILDINVPNINGLELLDLIYKKDATSKVIIISASTDINSLQKAYKFGCLDYLKKPFHLEELRIKISKQMPDKREILKSIRLKNEVSLTKKEKLLLILLLKNKNQVVSYEIIEQSVYHESMMSMASLRALVKRLRSKIVDNLIQNVLEEGYKIKS
jgi:DNA-binding response OmpR family regulator